MALILRPPGEVETLPQRLAGLGRSRRRVEMATGWCLLVALALTVVLVSCVLDVLLHLPSVVRCGLLVGGLAGVGVLYLRGVRTPGRQSTHPLSIAMLLEEKFPKLNDSLASAVDFLNADRSAQGLTRKHRFRDVAVLRAENLSKRLDFDSIIPTRPMWTGFWLAAVAFAVALPLGLSDPSRSKMALQRFFDPLGAHTWPTKTKIEVLEPVQRQSRLAKGEPFPIQFKLSGVLPDHAVVVVRLSDAGAVEDYVAVLSEETQAEVRLEFRIDGGRIPRDFDFRILANDAETPWYHVVVAPAPKLVPLEDRPSPQVHLTYPDYTDLAAIQLPDGTGVVEAVAGTVIHFRAATDLRIKHAVFRPQFDQTPILTASAVAALVSDNPLSALAAQRLADTMTADIPVSVSGAEGTILEAQFTPHQPGLYALRFTDETDLTGIRFFDFRMFPDPAPGVILEHPAARIDPLTLLPTATLPVQARAEDRPFAVKNLVLEYRIGGADAPFQHLPLMDLQAAGERLPALAGTMVGDVRPKPVTMEAVRRIPLSRFTKPNGGPLVDGDVLTLRAACWDWDDRSVLKEPGRSKEVEIRVLNKSSLEAQFQRDLAGLRPELLRLKEEQRDTRSKTEDLAKAAETGPLKPEDLSLLAQVEATQRQVRNRVADPTDGIRAKVDQLRETAQANTLPRSATTSKLDAVSNELNRLADQHLESAEPPLTTAKQEAEKGNEGPSKADPKKVADLLNQTAKQQKAAQESLESLLERLEQWGGAGEIRGEAQNLKDQINRAADQTKKAVDKIPAGKPNDQLSPTEKAELAGPADKLDQAAEQAASLQAKATRLADQKESQAKAAREKAANAEDADGAAQNQAAAQAQAEADALRKAVKESGGESLPNDIRNAAKKTRDNQPGEAETARQNALNRLDKLADNLTEKPSQSDNEMQKKRRDATEQIDKLAEEQDELRKKTKEAAAIPDPAKRDEELKKLAAEQDQLRRKTEQLLQRLTRDQADKAAEAVRKAAEQMEAARDELEQGKPATEKQEESLDKLDEALKKLDQEKKQDQDQLTREKREELAEQLKALRDKQKAAIDEAIRLQDTAKTAKRWDRPVLKSLDDLQEREKALAEDVRQFAEKNLAELPVFNKLATQSADAMKRASRYLGERREEAADFDAKFDPDIEKAADDRTGKPMATALRRLDQILNALKDDPKEKGKPAEGEPMPMPMPMEGEMGEGGMPPGDKGNGIPQLAQLKALRAMQAEVNEGTAEFAKAHPDVAKFTDDDRDDLKELEQAQRDVAELFEKLAEAFRKTPELP